MVIQVNLNGQILPSQDAKISIFDHGFLFGDSVYEVVRTYGGKPFRLKEHLHRLEKSADRIKLKIPMTEQQWEKQIFATLKAVDNVESYIRIMVTRGVGEVNLDPSSCLEPCYIILVKPLAPPPIEYLERGIKIVFVATQRNSAEALSPQIKSGNYLNNLLALMEAHQQGAQEGIMLNARGLVTEGTTSNLFLVSRGKIKTPSLESGILEGITRHIVFEIAEGLGIPISEEPLKQREVEEADEVFITSTTREVRAVHLVGDRQLNSPGPVTRRLQAAFEKKVDVFLQREDC